MLHAGTSWFHRKNWPRACEADRPANAVSTPTALQIYASPPDELRGLRNSVNKTHKMKLLTALALAASVPSSHAIGRYKACYGSAQCVEIGGGGAV